MRVGDSRVRIRVRNGLIGRVQGGKEGYWGQGGRSEERRVGKECVP